MINIIFIKYIKRFYAQSIFRYIIIKSLLTFSYNSKINYIKENNNNAF